MPAAVGDHRVPASVPVVLYPVVRCVPIAENAGDRSDRLDTSWAVPATAPPVRRIHNILQHGACVLRRFSPPVGPLPKSEAAVSTPPTLR
jgi:hypothetical protein